MINIYVLNYNKGSVDIIPNVPAVKDLPPEYCEDYEAWLVDIFGYNADEMYYMVRNTPCNDFLPIRIIKCP